ncbi:hypothetical protein C3L33_19298, partial [Rhododendron williamsianum]
MGNPKQKWTAEEEEALRAGVAKHGTGKWKNIQKDPEFNHFLYSRSNIDLKDKWRNMSVSATGQGPREKSRSSKAKANPDAPATPLLNAQTSVATTPVANDASADVIMEDSKCLLDGKTASKYNVMIYEALSTLKDPNGSDTTAIVSFIEVQNCYKIKKDVSHGAKTITATPKPKDIRPRQSQTTTSYLGDTVEEAAVAAAYKVAEAENKSFVAAEAVKEAERVAKMAEDADSYLQLAKEIFEKCSRGEVVLMC